MVRGRCGLVESDDEATTRAKIGETLAKHVPDAEERRWIEPALLALLGFGSGGGSEQLFAAWRTFFERLATQLAGRDGLRGSPLCGLRVARLRGPPPGVEPERPDLCRHPGPAGAAGEAAELGRGEAELHLHLSRAPLGPGNARAPRGPGPGPARGRGPGDRRARGRHPAVRGRDGPDAACRGQARAGGRHLPADRRPDDPGGPGDPHVADREPTRWARSGGPPPRLRRRSPRPVVHPRRPGGRLRGGRRRAGAAPARPGPPGAVHPGARRPVARARPVRVRPGVDPGGRLQHAGTQGPQGPASGRGPVLRGAGFGRARRRPRRPLPRRPCQRGRGCGGRRPRRPGPDRPQGGRRARRGAWLARPGRRPDRAGPDRDHGPTRGGRAARAGR